ncbi:10019_t:CDS:2 [Ambispora gerdemannii]|uniref:10019_t:CDS:1 n=1 Tax=Ambispora gerdemannii TaxID=144530 RepID=A0A9N8VUU4_9GLOM|nr:10019_t:CDS:2 [Ambispora gerdemannii]
MVEVAKANDLLAWEITQLIEFNKRSTSEIKANRQDFVYELMPTKKATTGAAVKSKMKCV